MFCSFCGAKEKADSIFCSKCGSRLAMAEDTAPDANDSDVNSTHLPPIQKSKPKLVLVFVAAAVVIAALGLVFAFQSNQVTEEAYLPPSPELIEEPIIDKSWVPAGFEWHSDDFATKWVTQEGDWPCSDCNFWKLKVIPQYDCSNGVYAELNMLDSADTVVDWSNDSLPSLSAGQTGLLIFENYPYDEGIDGGQLTELKCNR
jgi:hypothetical protein